MLRIMAAAAIAAADTNPRDAVLVDFPLSVGDDLLDLADLGGERGGVAFDADGGGGVGDGGQEGGFVESDDHAREVVGAEPCEGVVDELFGGGVGVLLAADEIDGFLVGADVPELYDVSLV